MTLGKLLFKSQFPQVRKEDNNSTDPEGPEVSVRKYIEHSADGPACNEHPGTISGGSFHGLCWHYQTTTLWVFGSEVKKKVCQGTLCQKHGPRPPLEPCPQLQWSLLPTGHQELSKTRAKLRPTHTGITRTSPEIRDHLRSRFPLELLSLPPGSQAETEKELED